MKTKLDPKRLQMTAGEMFEALYRLREECPYVCDEDRCECGENGNGFDNEGEPCEHIQMCRAIARATAASPVATK